MIAPFQYGFTQPTVFACSDERNRIVDSFRDFLATITQMFDLRDVSVIAHPFGSYIALRYLTGFEKPPTESDTLILTGAIVDCDLDIESLRYKVGHIFNDIAPNDEWVEWAKKANFAQDKLLGYAGTRGFTQKSDLLSQEVSEIFSHTNVIRRDTVAQRWMPILEANVGSVSRDNRHKFIQEVKEK